jgi:hypothetical protein
MKVRLFVLSVVAPCLTVGLIVLTGMRPMTAQASESAPAKAASEPYRQAWNVRPLAQLGGYAHAVAISGTVAYVAIAEHLTIVDISTPANPVTVGRSAVMPDTIKNLQIVGDLAYLADGPGGLRIVSIANPVAPAEIGHYDTVSDTIGLVVSGNLAYLTEDGRGLQIVDISNPTVPAPVGFYPLPAIVPDVSVVGTYVFIGRKDTLAFLSLDVSDPVHPKPAGPSNWWNTDGIPTFELAGGYMYVAAGATLLVFDVTHHPADLSYAESMVHLWGGTASDLAVDGDYLYIAAGPSSGLLVVSIAIPDMPLGAGQYYTDAQRLAAAGHYAYLSSEFEGGVRVIDARDPASPVENAYWLDGPQNATAITLSGSYAYVGVAEPHSPQGGLHVIDVADPAMPREVGFTRSTRPSAGIAVSGTLAYAVHGDGLIIFSVLDPNAPQELSFTKVESYPQAVGVTGHYAYVAASYGGLKILDVSAPTEPSLVHTESANVKDVTIAGNRAYYLTDPGLFTSPVLVVLDVSAPAEPVELGREELQVLPQRVKVAGRYACIAAADLGLQIIDVADPRSPVEAGLFAADSASDVTVAENFAYVLGAQGLHVIDVSNPADPVEVGFYPNLSGRLVVNRRRIFVVSGQGALTILRFAVMRDRIYLPTITVHRS